MGGEHGVSRLRHDDRAVLFKGDASAGRWRGAVSVAADRHAEVRARCDPRRSGGGDRTLAMRAIAAVVILMVIGPLLLDVFRGALWDCERRKTGRKLITVKRAVPMPKGARDYSECMLYLTPALVSHESRQAAHHAVLMTKCHHVAFHPANAVGSPAGPGRGSASRR
jgi:hypothetical protein